MEIIGALSILAAAAIVVLLGVRIGGRYVDSKLNYRDSEVNLEQPIILKHREKRSRAA